MIGLGFVAQWARRKGALRRRFNPYIAGAPLFDDRMFFGREELASRALNLLRHKSVRIAGDRRIGKTSFLHHLKKALAAEDGNDHRFFPVLIDLEGVPERTLFHALMAEMVDTLGLSPATLASLRFAPWRKGYAESQFRHDLQRVVEDLRRRTEKKTKLALLIDEVDVLNQYSERLGERLLALLMTTCSQNLVVVMAGAKGGVTGAWSDFFEELEVPAFTRDEAEALVKNPVSGVYGYQPSAIERILELSRLRPYLIQKVCMHAVNRILEESRTTIRVVDVEAAWDALHR